MKRINEQPSISFYLVAADITELKVKKSDYFKHWPFICELFQIYGGHKMKEFRGMIYYRISGDIVAACNKYLKGL